MDDKPVRVVRRDGLAQLLKGPGWGRMGCHVDVNHSTRSVLHDQKHVQNSKRGCRNDEEVTRDDGVSAMLEKS
jgi:hypothetical protein